MLISILVVFQETCISHLQFDDELVVIHAIKLAGRISHTLCRDMSGSSIKNLIAALARIAGDSESKKIKTMCLWYISMQNFTQAQASKMVPALLRAISRATSGDCESASLQMEGLKALGRILVRCCCYVSLFCCCIHAWTVQRLQAGCSRGCVLLFCRLSFLPR